MNDCFLSRLSKPRRRKPIENTRQTPFGEQRIKGRQPAWCSMRPHITYGHGRSKARGAIDLNKGTCVHVCVRVCVCVKCKKTTVDQLLWWKSICHFIFININNNKLIYVHWVLSWHDLDRAKCYSKHIYFWLQFKS